MYLCIHLQPQLENLKQVIGLKFTINFIKENLKYHLDKFKCMKMIENTHNYLLSCWKENVCFFLIHKFKKSPVIGSFIDCSTNINKALMKYILGNI